ncbi:MAG: phospholipase D-like domain-containing protein [Minisyncoccia bacterium]
MQSKTWFKIVKVINFSFIALCYIIAITSCVLVFVNGRNEIHIIFIILYIPLAIAAAWIISETPEQIFYYIENKEGYGVVYSRLKLGVGVISILFLSVLFAVLIFPFSDYQNGFVTSTVAPAGSPQFIQTFAHLTNAPIEYGDSVIPIDNGSQFLQVLLKTFDTASSSIDFTTFLWADGTFSDQIFAALTNAAQRGVQVRVLLDSLGSRNLSKANIATLQAVGGKVAEYHSFDISNPLAYDNRDHIRSIVIDGRIGFTGGMGISDNWFGNTPDKTFQDMMFEVRGAMAQSLQNSFTEIWNEATGEVLSGPLFYPSLEEPATQNTFVGITSVPSENYRPVRDAFMLTALSAQKKLYIASPYIVPDQDFLTILENKARAGVDVRIISPGEKTAVPILYAAWHADYSQLLQAGVKIYEYQPTMIHTKFIVADDTWSLIGSANMDNRSESLNAENIMGVNDPVLARSLDQTFVSYISRSKEFTAADWKREYGFFSQIYSKALLLFAKQY